MKTPYKYRLFNFTLASTIEIPELQFSENTPDIYLTQGETPEILESPLTHGLCFSALPGKFLLTINNIGRFYIEEGKKITIQPYHTSSPLDIRAFLLGTIPGIILQQKGFFTLHGSAVIHQNEAIIFAGLSGSGKSSIAASFIEDGNTFITDDICAIDFSNQTPQLLPGLPFIKLWEDSIEKLQLTQQPKSLLRDGIYKYRVPIPSHITNTPVSIKTIFILQPHNKKLIEHEIVNGIKKFNLLKENTYRMRFIKGMNLEQQHFEQCQKLCSLVPVIKIYRTKLPIDILATKNYIKEILSENAC